MHERETQRRRRGGYRTRKGGRGGVIGQLFDEEEEGSDRASEIVKRPDNGNYERHVVC